MVTITRYIVFVADNIAMNITSKIVALSSALAFGLQIALALLMLRYCSPEEVGIFSVISQIGFFWSTLALAQSPLRLLANQSISVFDDARKAWVSSLRRFLWLLPVAALAVWCSGLSFATALAWALLLSLCQLTWILAQSMRLRMIGFWAQIGVRVVPSLMALLVAVVAVTFQWSGFALLAAALIGYATGATWLLPALLSSKQITQETFTKSIATASGDDRSATLRMVHTLVDALLATAIMVVWQRLYGAQETGWMASPLRVMGFVPAVVHMAWAQVMLAQPQHARSNPLWVGLAGFACVALLGVGCAFALEMGWLDMKWQGVRPYLLPLVVWQGSACVAAAFSHLPFQNLNAKRYSFVSIGVAGLQIVALLVAFLLNIQPSAKLFINWFAFTSSIGLLVLGYWLSQMRRNNSLFNK